MFNKKIKRIAAFALSLSLALTAAGLSSMASAEDENGKTESTLEIAGAGQDEVQQEDAEGSDSLLDLAENLAGDTEEKKDDGLLALIDGAEAEDAQAEPAPEDVQAEPAPEAEPADAQEAQEASDEQAEPEPEPAPENGTATLETAPAEEEQAQEEQVQYEKLTATGSVTEGISALDVSAIVEAAMPSVVAVTTTSTQKVRDYFNREYEIEGQGAGSGIIISQNDTELLIVTNHHITSGSKELTVCFSVDSENEEDIIAPAVLKGESNKEDIAVIAVKIADIKPEVYKQLRVATLGSSDKLKVGEAAIVIGNALAFGQTVSTGIISALEREVQTELGTFKEFMTDAPINLGCSGGAILNSRGEVVGIVNAKDVVEYAEGMGYGVPIDSAIPILQDLINRETREAVEKHGYLGITVVPVSEEARTMYDMPAGAYVYEVSEGSAAEAAGIKKGNIITAFDGLDVTSSDDLVNRISYYNAGETVKVELQVAEGGEYVSKEVEVTLQEGPEEETEAAEDAGKTEEDKKEDEAPSNGTDPISEEDYFSGSDDGFGDPFDWFFGSGRNDRGSSDDWGSFYFGN